WRVSPFDVLRGVDSAPASLSERVLHGHPFQCPRPRAAAAAAAEARASATSGDVDTRSRGRSVLVRLRERTELVLREIIDVDEIHTLAIVFAQRRRLGLRDEIQGERLLNLARKVERRDFAGLHAIDADAFLDRLGALGEQ